MERDPSVWIAVLGWLPLIFIFLFLFVFLGRNAARNKEMLEMGRQNTEAVKANTEVLKAVLAKLENLPK